jgi:1-acyl-sn-glycerol-3-phosphate acyltransferase
MDLSLSLRRVARNPLRPLEAYARMLSAAGEDVLATATSRRPDDPFELRDPAYIQQTLPMFRVMSDLYFRADVRGLENIPTEGPVLLVGNHSGGTLIADTFVFAQYFYDHFGPGRRFHQLAHDLLFKMVGMRTWAERWGTVPASPDNMKRALDLGAALLVYPGGDHETFRPSWESDKIDFANRTGFIRLALEHEVPIVPVVAIGGQETGLFLGQGRRLARLLGVDQRMRLKVMPAVIAPPLGVTLMDLPLRVPLPAKITIEVLEPIHLRERLGANGDVEAGYETVTSLMQDTLSELDAERTLPILG